MYKTSGGKREAQEAYFARHKKAIARDRLKKNLRGQKRRDRLVLEKDQRAAVHALSYREIEDRSLRQTRMDGFFVKTANLECLGRQTGID